MKQLLIAKKNVALNYNNATPLNLTALADGALMFFEDGASTALTGSAEVSKKFSIAQGHAFNGTLQVPYLIPEVSKDFSVSKVVPKAGVHYNSGTITVGTTKIGYDFTVILVKKGTVPHERNVWHFTYRSTGTSAGDVADALVDQIKANAANLNLNVTHTDGNATFSIAGTDYQDWEVKTADDFDDEAMSTQTHAVKPVGDKAYVAELASKCAYGKGFADTYASGPSNIPGYPTDLENLIPALPTLAVSQSSIDGALDLGTVTEAPTAVTDAMIGYPGIKYTIDSTTYYKSLTGAEGYAIYTLQFAVGRASHKTRDEVVNQLVHIAVPVSTSGIIGKIDKILGL